MKNGVEPSGPGASRKDSDPIPISSSPKTGTPVLNDYQRHLQQNTVSGNDELVVGSPPGVHDHRRGRILSTSLTQHKK